MPVIEPNIVGDGVARLVTVFGLDGVRVIHSERDVFVTLRENDVVGDREFVRVARVRSFDGL